MTRKHFERLAVILSDIDSDVEFEKTLVNMIFMCQDENVRFDTFLFEKRARSLRHNRMNGGSNA